MDAAAASRAVRLIRDQELFREACYINGRWRPAVGGATIPVDDPATGEIIGAVPKLGRAENARSDRRRGGRVSRVARAHRQGAGRDSAPLVRSDHRQPGRPGAADDARAGQAARRVARRGRLRRVVHRVVRRGRQARLRRHHPVARPRQAHRRHQGADRRRRLHHAVELSDRDDHAQGRPGARRRLHGRREARVADAVLGARAGRAGRARRPAGRRPQRRHRLGRARSAAS